MARIVVADDDEDIRELVVFKLRQSGHDVVAVGDGAAAVAAVQEERPALVLLDVMMPGMSGLDAARVLRQSPDTAGIPVIMLTARAQETDIEQGFAAGADDYVTKPFSPRELASRVAAVLARSLLAQGRAHDALAAAREAHTLLESLGTIEEGEVMVRLAYAEALAANGQAEAFAQAITKARDQLLAKAGRISDPAGQERFLTAIVVNARTLALASGTAATDS